MAREEDVVYNESRTAENGRANTPSSIERHKYLDLMKETFGDVTHSKRATEGEGEDAQEIDILIEYNNYGNKHLFSDSKSRSRSIISPEDLVNMPQYMEGAEHAKYSESTKQRKDSIVGFHYYKTTINGETAYINVAKRMRESANGSVHIDYFPYSVTASIRED